jgi:hypothetical protein
MTAVVGIMNKQAIAIAADSAVTIGNENGSKIFNKANKVFSLSKRHPVGIMIYNSATFMSTPWEIIIKIYRNQLADKSFSTLCEYKDDFLIFVKDKNYFTDSQMQKQYLHNFIGNILNSFLDEIDDTVIDVIEPLTEENKVRLLVYLDEKFDLLIDNLSKNTDFCPNFIDYSQENFYLNSNDLFEEILKLKFIDNGFELPDAFKLKFKLLVYHILKSKENDSEYTGLIFCGFGENEIYPQLIPLNISFVFDNRMRYYIDENRSVSISNSLHGAVRPFAQTDVIDTILSGIDPSLERIYLNNIYSLLQNYNSKILESIGDTNPLLTEQIKNLDNNSIINELNKINREIKQEKFIQPLMNAVSTLGKEDLAEMAESLIYLTYLKRRITFAEESVGGPVDVAVISKGDGFVWIKRKHYFNPTLNQHFFDNYFK